VPTLRLEPGLSHAGEPGRRRVRLVPVRASQTDWPDVAEAGTGVGVLSAHDRAWEAVWELAANHSHDLTPAQHIVCLTTVMRHPDRAALEVIALAAQVLGERV
jgi:hypothetical protein